MKPVEDPEALDMEAAAAELQTSEVSVHHPLAGKSGMARVPSASAATHARPKPCAAPATERDLTIKPYEVGARWGSRRDPGVVGL